MLRIVLSTFGCSHTLQVHLCIDQNTAHFLAKLFKLRCFFFGTLESSTFSYVKVGDVMLSLDNRQSALEYNRCMSLLVSSLIELKCSCYWPTAVTSSPFPDSRLCKSSPPLLATPPPPTLSDWDIIKPVRDYNAVKTPQYLPYVMFLLPASNGCDFTHISTATCTEDTVRGLLPKTFSNTG